MELIFVRIKLISFADFQPVFSTFCGKPTTVKSSLVSTNVFVLFGLVIWVSTSRYFVTLYLLFAYCFQTFFKWLNSISTLFFLRTHIDEERVKFDTRLRKVFQGSVDEHPKPKLFSLNRGQMFPEKMLMTDYKFDGIETYWPWLKSDEANFDHDTHISNALVPTKETNIMLYWLNLSVKISLPCILVGDTAVGKSFTIRQFLNELPKEKFIHSVLNLAANTKPQTVQEIVMAKLDRRRKGVFGPPVGKLVSFNR